MPPRFGDTAAIAVVAGTIAASGCLGLDTDFRSLALEAYCEVPVSGVGTLDVENDYLPHVIACENGAADFEALKVQAISARSYLYYKLDTSGQIGDGTGDQVYTCNNMPGDDHFDAVTETSGEVLQYMGTQVAAFYVAGALQEPPGCVGGGNDPTATERYVTYNEGKSGAEITQTSLGFVSPGNFANRGCMSQNGSHCLAELGRGADEILRFYYGEDIERVVSEGPCVSGVPGGDPDGTSDLDGGCQAGGGGGGGGALVAIFLAALLSPRRRSRRAR
jgi:hypothetical protein